MTIGGAVLRLRCGDVGGGIRRAADVARDPDAGAAHQPPDRAALLPQTPAAEGAARRAQDDQGPYLIEKKYGLI